MSVYICANIVLCHRLRSLFSPANNENECAIFQVPGIIKALVYLGLITVQNSHLPEMHDVADTDSIL